MRITVVEWTGAKVLQDGARWCKIETQNTTQQLQSESYRHTWWSSAPCSLHQSMCANRSELSHRGIDRTFKSLRKTDVIKQENWLPLLFMQDMVWVYLLFFLLLMFLELDSVFMNYFRILRLYLYKSIFETLYFSMFCEDYFILLFCWFSSFCCCFVCISFLFFTFLF